MSRARRPGAIPLALLVYCFAVSPSLAAMRMPVPDGRYCGPDGATIGIDGNTGVVTIAGYACGIPIFAADKLQSIQCRRGDGPPERREFDVRVLDGAFLYNGQWFRPCAAP